MGAIVAFTIAACGATSSSSTTTTTTAPSDVASACTSDADCMLVDACCNCSNGGGRIAIRKDQLELYTKQRPSECANVACAEMVSGDPSCNSEAECRNGSCAVLAHRNDQKHGIPR